MNNKRSGPRIIQLYQNHHPKIRHNPLGQHRMIMVTKRRKPSFCNAITCHAYKMASRNKQERRIPIYIAPFTYIVAIKRPHVTHHPIFRICIEEIATNVHCRVYQFFSEYAASSADSLYYISGAYSKIVVNE